MYIEKEIGKIYWNIGEVARLIGRRTSAIRFWESSYKWIRVKKGKHGERKYTESDVMDIIHIDYLVNHFGMTERGIKRAKENHYFYDLIDYGATMDIRVGESNLLNWNQKETI